jgi:hypothetical protein
MRDAFAGGREGIEPQMQRNSRWTWPVIAALAFLNFMAFVAGTLVLGGDALNGKVVNGHYFLNSHGRHTEVTRATYSYSWWHGASLTASFVLFAVAAYYGRRRD